MSLRHTTMAKAAQRGRLPLDHPSRHRAKSRSECPWARGRATILAVQMGIVANEAHYFVRWG